MTSVRARLGATLPLVAAALLLPGLLSPASANVAPIVSADAATVRTAPVVQAAPLTLPHVGITGHVTVPAAVPLVFHSSVPRELWNTAFKAVNSSVVLLSGVV